MAFGPRLVARETPFEVALGAILTQNTNWHNVAKVMVRLKAEGLLSARALTAAPEAELAGLFRPAGYYNLKARRVKNFLALLEERYQGSMAALAREDWEAARTRSWRSKASARRPRTASSSMPWICPLSWWMPILSAS